MSDNAAEGGRRKEKDYFSVPKSSASDRRDDSATSAPHIAFQEKGRTASSDHDVARLKSAKYSKTQEQGQRKASAYGDEFKLQEAPVVRKGVSTRSSASHSPVPQDHASNKINNGIVRKDGHSNLSEARRVNEARISDDSDGIKPSSRLDLTKPIPRKGLPPTSGRNCKFREFSVQLRWAFRVLG